MGPHDDEGGVSEPLPGIRTFLIADIRGYTAYTQEHGDEGAALLAARFAADLEPVVTEHSGQLLELRGDEALVVFASARQAIRAAVALQKRFAGPGDQALPIGIGLDAGEAVAVRGGFRGAALNTAARLCSLAAPGEVLATPEVVHLATRVAGVRFLEHGQFQLKGIAAPVHVVRLEPDPEGPGAAPPAPRPGPRLLAGHAVRTALLGTIVLVAALVVALGPLGLRPHGNPGSSSANEGSTVTNTDPSPLKVAFLFPPAFTPVVLPATYMVPDGGVEPPHLPAGRRTQPSITVPGSPAYVRWHERHGGVPWLHQTVRFVLTGADDAPVVISRIRPYIIDRSAPLSGWRFEFECCGGVLVRFLEADLECPSHPAVLSVPNPKTGIVRRRTTNIDLQVSRTDPEELELTVYANHAYLQWGVEITYTHDGKVGTTRVTDPRGRMRVTGEKPGSIRAYRYVDSRVAAAQHEPAGLHRAPGADTTSQDLRFIDRFDRRHLC